MEIKRALDILPQPDDVTCGPTCLQAVCCYDGDARPLEQVMVETASLLTGGTSGVLLACHALRYDYSVTIDTSSNLPVCDSPWLHPQAGYLSQPLHAQIAHNHDAKFHLASARIDPISGAILLGVLAHDANLVLIEPRPQGERCAHSYRCQ